LGGRVVAWVNTWHGTRNLVRDDQLRTGERAGEALSRYHDTYREEVLKLLKKKAEGKEIVVDEPEEEQSQVLDLMAALEASLADAKKGGRSKKPAPKKSTKKTSKRTSSRSRSRTKKSA
jgi:DNA end-binding protein Ku